MMISPTAAEAAGADFGAKPICSGPYKFVERVAQDRIVLEKFADHWNADAYPFAQVIFLPLPATTVRLAHLPSGDPDILARLAATASAAVTADANQQYDAAAGPGYHVRKAMM